MKIYIKKTSNFQFEYTITRPDNTVEVIILETKTYLTHDVCHFVVENKLQCKSGFWGMLAKGYTIKEFSGKKNPLSDELRYIEQIVGQIQLTFLGKIPKQDFNQYVHHLKFAMSDDDLNFCLDEINGIIQTWNQLPIGEKLTLIWDAD